MARTHVLYDHTNARWLAFDRPLTVLRAHRHGDVLDVLQEADRLVQEKQHWAAGFFTYEAAAAFDPAMHTHPPGPLPLVELAIFRTPVEIPPPQPAGARTARWKPEIAESDYLEAIDRIKAQIASGNTYQVNYTLRMHARLAGDPWELFRAMVAGQRSGFPAFIRSGPFAICSASPELFFTLDGDRLQSRPMKGTAPRGKTLEEDQEQAAWLQASEKNRAENVMIVDMVRNDMGRIARTGSVRVPALFDIERYPTILQMTSTVECQTDATVPEIFKALFPCASITGAPKISTMNIIRELETSPRGVYTGAIGFWGPGRRAQFNVAIRTAVLDEASGAAVYGTGSGIVWDSDGREEYAECLVKARVLAAGWEDFQLLESLRWTAAQGYFLFDRHLDRMASSAAYFDLPFNRAQAVEALERAPTTWRAATGKVRLLLNAKGVFSVEFAAIPSDDRTHEELLRPVDRPLLAGALARAPVNPENVHLYHKTTRRGLYEGAKEERPEADHVLLWNDQGQLTEFTTSNLVYQRAGVLCTPPVTCGLLPGTLRAELLARGIVHERILQIKELETVDTIWAVNSVRGWQPVRLKGPPDPP